MNSLSSWTQIGACLALGAFALYAVACAAIADRFTRSRRVALSDAGRAAAAELAADQVHFPARDGRARIEAWYLAAKPRRAAVVFVHGKDARRGDELKAPTLALARRLVARGVSVLMIDLRGHGSSSASRLSYGQLERHDVLGAVDWLLERGYPSDAIGVLGGSMGAATALLAAADEPMLRALVVDSPFADFAEMIERQYRKLSGGLPGWLLPGALLIGRWLSGAQLRRVCPLRAAAALRERPVLVIHGSDDRFIPVQDGRRIAAACGGELWVTEGPGHLGSYRSAPQAYEDRVVAFFAQHLLVPASQATEAHRLSADACLRSIATDVSRREYRWQTFSTC